MRSLRPEQILLLLLFVLVPIVNLLVRWVRRRTREQQRPGTAAPRASEPVARETRPPAPVPPRVRVIEPTVREGLGMAPPAPRTEPVIRRAGPLGGRTMVRRTIVAMTILGPCRGLEDPPPMAPAHRSSSRQP